MDSGILPGAISILYKDGVYEVACLGYADVDAKRPITLDDVYMQCSQSKGFCGVTVAKLVEQGLVVVCCTISMFDDVRNYNREHNSAYTEIFLDVPMDVLMKRNQKGLYEKCQKGQNVAVAGVNVEIEFPKNPDIIIHNDGNLTIEECVSMIMEYSKREV